MLAVLLWQRLLGDLVPAVRGVCKDRVDAVVLEPRERPTGVIWLIFSDSAESSAVTADPELRVESLFFTRTLTGAITASTHVGATLYPRHHCPSRGPWCERLFWSAPGARAVTVGSSP